MAPPDPSLAAELYTALIDVVFVKATVIVAAAAMACRLSRRRSASVRHGIWAVAFLGLLVLSAVRLAVPESRVTLVAVRSPAPAVTMPAPWPTSTRPGSAVDGGPFAGAASTAAMGPRTPTRTPLATVGIGPWHHWFVVVWILGFGFQLVRFGAHSRAIAGLRTRSTPCSDRIQRQVRRTARELCLASPPLTVVSSGVSVPSTFGVIRPTIVLPPDIDRWSADKLDAALFHELVHLRRRDYVTHLMTVLVMAAHWINPFVWYAGRRLVRERERACDDHVVLDRIDRIRYAECLVSVAHHDRVKGAYQMPSLATRSSLAERVRSLLDDAQARGPLGAHGRLAIVVLAALVVAPVTAIEITGLMQEPDELEVALSDSDPVVRRRAAWAMGESEDRVYVPSLVEGLTDADARVRAVAAWALGEIKDTRAIEPLIGRLEDEDGRVHEMAILAIGEVEDRSGLRAIREAGAGVSIEARDWAAAQIEHRKGYPEVFAGELLHPLARQSDVVRYVEELAAADPRGRALAAQRLGILGAARAVDPLLDVLEDEDAAVRAAAIWALDEINPSRSPRATDR